MPRLSFTLLREPHSVNTVKAVNFAVHFFFSFSISRMKALCAFVLFTKPALHALKCSRSLLLRKSIGISPVTDAILSAGRKPSQLGGFRDKISSPVSASWRIKTFFGIDAISLRQTNSLTTTRNKNLGFTRHEWSVNKIVEAPRILPIELFS